MASRVLTAPDAPSQSVPARAPSSRSIVIFELVSEDMDRLSPARDAHLREYIMSTLAEQWASEGEAKGRAEGE